MSQSLYNIAGDYASALKYYEEATDSLKAHSIDERNDGAIQLFGDLSSLYAFLGMPEQALAFSDSAIVEIRRQDGAMLSDVYRFRAGIYELDDKVAEAMNAYPDNRDSVALAVSILENTVEYDEFDTADRVYALGLGYVKQGKTDRGIALLQEAADSYRRQEDMERIHVANTALLEVYARHGMCRELQALVPQYIEDAERAAQEEQSSALISAMVKYDIKSTEDRNHILMLQLEVEQEKKLIIYGIAFVVIIILLGFAVIFWQRSRLLNQKRLLQQKELEGLGESNDMLNKRVGILEKDLTAGMNSNSSILSDPQLITGKEEGRFRRAFNVLFPNFIPLLKKDYPRLTPNDELLCMLLYLKHTTEEVSIYLGISKASVNSARYRLRTKFALPKDMELDTFIAGRSV